VPFWLLGVLFFLGAACWVFVDPRRRVFGDAAPGAQPAYT